VEIRLATLGDAHPQTATGLTNLARMLTIAGQLDEAEVHARRALEVARAGWGDDHPRTGKAYEALALIYRDQGQIALARDHAERTLAIYRAAPGVAPGWVEAIEMVLEAL
jgi:tetratricopeptide (TPR) repeat protein